MMATRQCKYCMKRVADDELGVFSCAKCTVCVHELCCTSTGQSCHRAGNLKGDFMFTFECRECSFNRCDTFTRMKLTWAQLIHLALYNLTVNETGRQGYFRWKDDICRFIDHNWLHLMPGREKTSSTSGTIAGALSLHSKLFKSGFTVFKENGWWALQRVVPPTSNTSSYKPVKSSSVTIGQMQKRVPTPREVVATDDDMAYGRGKRQRSTKEKKKKENVSKIVKMENKGILLGSSAPAAPNNFSCLPIVPSSIDGSKIIPSNLVPTQIPATLNEPCLNDFCSLTDIELSDNGKINSNHEILDNTAKAEETCFSTLNSYDRKIAQENGLFPLNNDNPFSMEYSPEDIADFIPPMFDEKNEFDKIVEEFKEYNAQRETSVQHQQPMPPLEIQLPDLFPPENAIRLGEAIRKEEGNMQMKAEIPPEIPDVRLALVSEEPMETVVEIPKDSIKCEIETNEELEQEDVPEGAKSVAEESSCDQKNEMKKILMTIHDEAALLSKLNEFEFVLNADPSLRRLRRKLLLRKTKRGKGHKLFSLQESCELYAQRDAPAANLELEPDKEKVAEPHITQPCATNGPAGSLEKSKSGYHHPALQDVNVLDRFFNFSNSVHREPKNKSIFVRLLGSEETTASRSITSPYTSRVLKPYIRRDFQTLPRKLKLLNEIRNHPRNRGKVPNIPHTWPIDYCYVQPYHLPAVNALCSDFFWPGIEMTEALQYPEFSCVVVYRKLVIGFAFMVPDVKYNEAYISFILVHPDWQRASIGTNMIYHLIQTCMGKDITLHVSPTNTSLLFYQKFGFKAEKLLLGFYNKYLPEGDVSCPHAFVLRLRR